MSSASTPTRSPALTYGTLLFSSGATLVLAVYQWLELIAVRRGGQAACAVNETVNCATVWNSNFAHLVHSKLGMPVAALGVLWALVALMVSGVAWQRQRAVQDPGPFGAAVKLWAMAGVLAVVAFISASVQARALCLTCLGTYVLVSAYAVGAFVFLEGGLWPRQHLLGGVGFLALFSAPVFLGLLYPGGRTPENVEAQAEKLLNPHDPTDVGALITRLPLQDRQVIAFARQKWIEGQALDRGAYPVHARMGNPAAPVRIVEFTDILCPHCARFDDLTRELDGLAPEGGLSIEPRYYPLDSECNPQVQGTLENGVRCFGAKVQICTEQDPKFFLFRKELYENQQQLDQGLMLAIARRHGIDVDQLQSCVKRPETTARLNEDIAFATMFNITGTPLVLLNEKSTLPVPGFLVGMVASGGNVEAPFFKSLPPVPPELEKQLQ